MRRLVSLIAVLLAAGCGSSGGADPDGAVQPDSGANCAVSTCNVNATCDDSSGAPVCVCNDGFTGTGSSCQDVDECADDLDDCSADATCTNTAGSFTCDCDAGYTGDGLTCTDVDECVTGTDTCDPNAVCTNQPGAFSCACEPGYTGDGTTCVEIDECAEGTAGCGANATCSNSPPGSFTCTCDVGYVGDGFLCTDVDECVAMIDVCDPNSFCANVTGSYDCFCNPGFTGDGFTCTDVDECADGTDLCDPAAICTNAPGGYDCTCPPGYAGDGFTCVDADECTDGTDVCHPSAICTNAPGSYTCACAPGFTGDGFFCSDIDECAAGTAGCDVNATCANSSGGFTCTCNPGYSGTGFTCTAATGHVVLMGHDFFQRNADMDRLLTNAVLLANTGGDIQILGYQQYADTAPDGEVANSNAAITAGVAAQGRTAAITPLVDYTTLSAALAGKHVLIVYEMELGGDAVTIGNAWKQKLAHFLAGGGVVIVMDFLTTGWQILGTAGVLAVTGTTFSVSGQSLTLTSPGDPIVAGLPNPYTAGNDSIGFNTTEPGIVATSPSGQVVVIHKAWDCTVQGSDVFGYNMCKRSSVAVMPCDDIRTTGSVVCASDDCTADVTLPFAFTYYGGPRTILSISSNGQIGFPVAASYANSCPISNNTIAAYWDDLYPPLGGGSVRQQVLGTAPARRFVVSWNVPHIESDATFPLFDIRAVLHETTNTITYCYVATTTSGPTNSAGGSATIGIQGLGLDQGIVYSCNTPDAPSGTVIEIHHP